MIFGGRKIRLDNKILLDNYERLGHHKFQRIQEDSYPRLEILIKWQILSNI